MTLPVHRPARSVALVVAGALASGCAASNTRYQPQVVARGELTLRYEHGFEMVGGGRQVAHALDWRGLDNYVRCVPVAERSARHASSDGMAAVALSILGGVFAGGAVATAMTGAVITNDTPDLLGFLGIGVGAATVGTVFAGLGRLYRNRANGQAVDAMNYYNDAVGSLGATCDDLTYPPPAGPAQ